MAKTTEALKSSYDKLMAKAKEIKILQTIESIVGWDMETRCPQRESICEVSN